MRTIILTLIALILAVIAGSPVQAQIAKQGKFSGTHTWHWQGQGYEVGQERYHWVGTTYGVYSGANGGGVLHNSSTLCSWASELKGQWQELRGSCAVTDKDGDKVFYAFRGTRSKPDEGVAGEMEIYEGTGKYAGIGGKAKYRDYSLAMRVGPREGYMTGSGEGFTTWEGDYRLP